MNTVSESANNVLIEYDAFLLCEPHDVKAVMEVEHQLNAEGITTLLPDPRAQDFDIIYDGLERSACCVLFIARPRYWLEHRVVPGLVGQRRKETNGRYNIINVMLSLQGSERLNDIPHELRGDTLSDLQDLHDR
ncbi:MAG TPA: hypothetical protein VE775_05675, partial [Pyrinomonadaceae bacterium]|nr:hypothetical protein [Pyrinomonadaceae bacterium]